MDVSHLLDGLNDAQREAVAAPMQNLLVLAGAGSGKTRVLVHRIAWLMQIEGISPTSIMAVTFTNKAAKEMRGRIEDLLNIPSRGMWFGTFHGIAHRFLRAHFREAELPENFQILDSDDQLRIIKRLMRDRGIDEARIPPRQVQGFINSRKDEGVRAKHLAPAKNPFDKQIHGLYLDYEEQCQQSGLVDFGELLLRSHEIWLNHPALLSHYQERFSYLLVDEFQDTNTVQYAWLRVLAGDRIPVMVVGDDDQSIYGWRGAKIENIRQYESDFANTHTVRLEQNYRSTGNILNAANALISNNGSRLGKQLWTDDKDGELIDLYAGFNEQDEANYIADRIAAWVEQGNLRQDTAILYRSNAQSRILEESLIRANIPYRIYGGLRFYDRQEIRNAMAYLRLCYYQHDDAAFERVANVPPRGLGEKGMGLVRERAREAGSSLWQSCAYLLEQGALKGKAKTGLAEFMDFIETLSTQIHELSLSTLTETAVKDSGLMGYHASEKGEKGQARKENLEELIGSTHDYEPEDDEQPILAQFIAQAALDAGEQQAAEHEDSVQLMTLHSAKGLEFPLVFMAGMEENLFPHSMSMEEPGRLEEERRLAYVGVTRAREKLVLTYAESRRLYGEEKFNPISRFVREIPSENIQEVRLRNAVSRPVSFGGNNAGLSDISHLEDAPEFQLGDLVSHPKFGYGTVVHYEGRGPHARIQVMFEEHGNKWLVLSYAKLSKV
ncbi:MAG: DNA helicase II [Oleiphilaceae bacterium]|nr:DNA helicase II [Oleiphilaceae bacterium]